MTRFTAAQEALHQRLLRALGFRPGASPTCLANITGIRRQQVDDALHRLMRAGTIVDRGSGRNHAYDLKQSGAGPGTMLRGPPLNLLNLILAGDGAAFTDLVEGTGLSKSEVSRLGTRLHGLGLIEPVKLAGRLYYLPINQLE